MASTPVGGLHIDVKLDTSQAIAQLKALQAEFQKTMSTGATKQATNAMNTTTAAVNKTTSSVKAMNQTVGQSTAAFSQFGQAAILGMRNPLYGITAASGAATTSIKAIGGAATVSAAGMATFAAALLAVAAAGAAVTAVLYQITQVGIESGRTLERLGVSMEAMFRGTEDAARAAALEVDALVNLAIESPFLTDTIINLDKFLLSQGVVAGQLRGDLVEAVLDLGSALGLADSNLTSVTYALAQVQARGYLSGDELRQLANQFIPVWTALSELPEFAGQTAQQLRKSVEQGEISSTKFFEALINYAGRYEDTAAKAAATTDGLINKFQDILSFSIGQAFIDVDEIEGLISPLGLLRDMLERIVDTAQQIDFRPLAASLGALLSAIFGPLSDFVTGSGQGIVYFFQVSLPTAVTYTAEIFRVLGTVAGQMVSIFYQAFAAVWASFKTLISQIIGLTEVWQAAFTVLGVAAALGMAASITALSLFAASLGSLVGVVRIAVSAIKALFAFISGDGVGAVNAYNDAIDGATALTNSFFASVAAPAKAIRTTVDSINAVGGAIENLKNIEIPDFGADGTLIEGLQDAIGGGPASGGAAGSDSGGGGGGVAATVSEIEKAMDVLWDLSQRWYGLRSDLEKGFLGTTGFEATVDQIVAIAKKVTTALDTIGRSDVSAFIAAGTYELIALAEERAKVTSELVIAEKNLDDLIRQRDAYTAAIRKSAIDFAAALKLDSEVVKEFSLQSERGFFIEQETTQTKSFVDSLKARSAALDEFFNNIKLLQAAGLNEDLLNDLLTAGPQQSGEVAKAIAEGGEDMIAEINVLYGDIADTADALGDFGAETFYDSGVEQAQGLVDGLTSELAEIEETAQTIVDVIYTTIQPFTKEMEDLGKEGGGALAGGLGSTIGEVTAAAGGISSGITGAGGLGALPSDIKNIGDESTFAIEDFMGDWGEAFLDGVDGMIGTLDRFRTEVETSLQGLKLDITGDVNIGALRYKFFDALLKMFQDIPIPVRVALFGPGYYLIEQALSRARGSGGGRITGSGTRTNTSSASASGFYSMGAAYGAMASAYGFADTGVSTRGTGAALYGNVGQTTGYGETNPQDYQPVVKVYIGDEELKTMIQTEVIYAEDGAVTRYTAGRRS